MFRYLKLFGLFVRISIQDDAAYRVDFLVHMILSVVQLLGELMGLWVIFANTTSLNDWNAWQILALLGVFRIMSGVIGLAIAPNMRQIMEDIRDGKLDFVIMKPVNTQFFASTRRVIIWRLTDVVVGLGVAFFASLQLSAELTALQVVQFLIMLAVGVTIIYSFWLTLATLAFWFTRISNIEMVFWNVFEAGRYPVDIYRPSIRLALTYVIPLAFLTTFPASALVGKPLPAGGILTALLIAAASFTFASLFWRFGLSRYSGASA